MPFTTRRSFLRHVTAVAGTTALASALPASLWSSCASAAEGDDAQHKPSSEEADKIAAIAAQFLSDYKTPGLSVAFARKGQFVYQAGFGTANDGGEKVTPDHLFRIASVAKPFTSATIFALLEKGDLQLDDHVFGRDGHLGFDYGRTYPENVNQITVHHLLTHTGGGWSNRGNDPMFSNPEMNHAQLIAWTLRNRALEHEPGEHFAYSNFGYCVLGRLIENLTGVPYIEAVQKTILTRCEIKGMRLATNGRAQGEVAYYGQNGENLYSMNVSRMDSHGGWIATPSDLVRFAMRADGFPSAPDFLQASSIKTMTTPTKANANYACGWCINSVPNWWHNGSLPGTSSIMVRTASGLCWAALTNSRTKGIDGALDSMMWQIARAVPAWKA